MAVRERDRRVGDPSAEARGVGRPSEGSREDGTKGAVARRGKRLASVDALRGLAIVILLLAGNPFMRPDLPAQLKHPNWHGLSFADLFFPLFLFIVGIAMSLSSRTGSGRLVLRRVLLLALIGVALSSFKHGRLYPTGVLQHIAGAYLVAWLILRSPRRIQFALGACIVGALWLAYVLYAGAGADPWSRERTLAHAVDGWIFGGFSTEGTLQTIASGVTVLGGALIGRGMKERREPGILARWVAGHAAWLISAGLLLALVVPLNKRLWSPSFTILTIGTSCAMFVLFIWLMDVRDGRRWFTPLVQLGANPIAIYVGFIAVRALVADFKGAVPQLAPFGSETVGAMLYSSGWLALGLLAAHLLYRRRLFLKI